MKRFSRIAALVVAAVGGTVLLGWFLDVSLLKSGLPGLVTMKVNTACAFLAAGVALWILPAAPAARSLAAALSLMVVLVGGLSLAQYLFGLDFGIDQLIHTEHAQAAGSLRPGRMSPATALSFLLVGLALLALSARQSRQFVTQVHWLVLPVLFVSTTAIVGYAYDVTSLYTVGPFVSMAIHTALSFLLLSLAILAGNPEVGIVRLMVSDTAGGVVARRLFGTLPLAFFLLGWALLAGQHAGFYDETYGLALMVVLGITLSVLAIASTAAKLHAVDVERQQGVAEIVSINAGLERRVQERTLELETTLGQVKQLRGLLPICAWCKKVRDDQDYWQSVEEYVSDRTDARFTHDICPTCLAKEMATV